jgi:endonuclease-3
VSAPHTPGDRVRSILKKLDELYPDAECSLTFRDPLQLLVATILSAQCTDERVNQVTPVLFARYPDARALAEAAAEDVEEIIRSTGFFRAKARSLIGCATGLVARHGGQVPGRMEDLVELPGVGRKTANVVLGHAFGVESGIAVDTHVFRVSQRLGMARAETPEQIEEHLMALLPRARWSRTSDLLIFHGRKVCAARSPRCGGCPVFDLCAFDDRIAIASAGAKR